MSQSIKISKKGFDVKTAKDNKLLFNADYPLLKVNQFFSGSVDCTYSNPLQTVDIPHDLGIIPMYFVFAEVIDATFNKLTGYRQLPYSTYVGVNQYIRERVLPDESKLRLEFDLTYLIAIEHNIKYYGFIFEDPIIDIETYG